MNLWGRVAVIGPNGAGKSTMIKALGYVIVWNTWWLSYFFKRHRWSRHWWVSCQLLAGRLFGNIPMSGPEHWVDLETMTHWIETHVVDCICSSIRHPQLVPSNCDHACSCQFERMQYDHLVWSIVDIQVISSFAELRCSSISALITPNPRIISAKPRNMFCLTPKYHCPAAMKCARRTRKYPKINYPLSDGIYMSAHFSHFLDLRFQTEKFWRTFSCIYATHKLWKAILLECTLINGIVGMGEQIASLIVFWS